MNRIVVQLAAQGLLRPAINVEKRIEEEILSLERCKKRKGFLGVYDTAIRYSFLIVLSDGYDIDRFSVHNALRALLTYLLNEKEANAIISLRHRTKYSTSLPNLDEIQKMRKVIQLLKDLIPINHQLQR